ncbi:hypothetical protein [Alteromonas sp. 14N.309.X.WAT.G.H12]|uniref:helix-turn-helix transcriptional regulator n=1 Tax=Alteromonas sp. 14N.309.X.WAT.G.H12 TaxID=3120824 RepID=UPI002FD13FB4
MEVERDIREYRFNLDAFILEIYDASLSRKWSRVLEQCLSLFSANNAFLLLHDAVNKEFVSVKMKTTEVLSDASLRHYREHFHQDPLYLQSKNMEEGSIFTTCEQTRIDWRKYPDYHERILAPLKAEKTKAALVLKDSRYEAFFGVCRSKAAPDFTPLDDVYFKKIVPHLVRASRYFRDQENCKTTRSIAQGIFDNQAPPFLVCNRQLKIQASNASAQVFLQDSQNCHDINGYLALSPARYLYQLLRAMDNCIQEISSNADKTHSFIIDERREAMTVLTVAILNTYADTQGAQTCFVLSFSVKQQPDWKVLSATFLLTKQEQLIAQLLYKEVTYQGIAHTLSLDEEAVTSLVRSLYIKMGTPHRRDFLELIADLPIQTA